MFFNGASFAIGFATGFGTGYLSREITTSLKGGIRPLAKQAVRSAFIAVDKLRETVALAGETFEDLIAEAKAELARPATQPSPEEVTSRIEAAAAEGLLNRATITETEVELELDRPKAKKG